jgi:hypothetical protein
MGSALKPVQCVLRSEHFVSRIEGYSLHRLRAEQASRKGVVMQYEWTAIPDTAIPRATNPVFQHLLDTYVSESNKVASTWKEFADSDLDFKPHPLPQCG